MSSTAAKRAEPGHLNSRRLGVLHHQFSPGVDFGGGRLGWCVPGFIFCVVLERNKAVLVLGSFLGAAGSWPGVPPFQNTLVFWSELVVI